MPKPLKILLSILISVVSLSAVMLMALPFVVDPNDFKAEIERTVYENTGRSLAIAGDLELSIFPWLGVSTGKLTLGNAAGFSAEPFAQVIESDIKIKLWPLLFKELEVSEIVLKGVSVNLSKNRQGQSNWADLAALVATKDTKPNNPLKLLEIAGVTIQQAQLNWNDRQSGQVFEITHINLESERFAFDTPVTMQVGLSVHDKQRAITETLTMAADWQVNEALDTLHLKHFTLKTLTEGAAIPNHQMAASLAAEVDIELKKQQLSLSTAQFKTGELVVEANLTAQLTAPFAVASTLHIPPFDAAKFMQQHLALKLPEMADEKALNWVGADVDLHADAHQVKLDNLSLQIDQTALTGKMYIRDWAHPSVGFGFNVDILNADRYLPIPGRAITPTVVLTPGASMAAKADLLPLDTLRKWDVNGNLLINDLKINNLTMQGVRLTVNAKQGFIQSLHSVDRLYQGSYKGKIAVDARPALPVLNFEHRLSHIQLGPLLTDLQGQSKLSGLVDMHAQLASEGNTEIGLKSTLNGRLQLLCKNALIRGTNLQKIMDDSTISFKKQPLDAQDSREFTAFSKITATAVVSNGLVNNNDLSVTASRLKVAGFGSLNLLSEQIDYKLITLLLKEKLVAAQAKVVKHLPLFISVSGDLRKPIYEVDLVAMGLAL